MKEESNVNFPPFHCWLNKDASNGICCAEMDAARREHLNFAV